MMLRWKQHVVTTPEQTPTRFAGTAPDTVSHPGGGDSDENCSDVLVEVSQSSDMTGTKPSESEQYSSEEIRQHRAEQSAMVTCRPDGEDVILLTARCESCQADVIRRFDIVGNLLVVGPWVHVYRHNHKVTRIEVAPVL